MEQFQVKASSAVKCYLRSLGDRKLLHRIVCFKDELEFTKKLQIRVVLRGNNTYGDLAGK